MKDLFFVVPVLIDTLTLLLLCSAISERRFQRGIHWILVVLFMITGTFMIEAFYELNPWIKLLCMLLWNFSFTFLFQGSALYKAVLTILHFNISIVFETISLTFFLFATGGTIDALIKNVYIMDYVILISRIMLMIVCFFLVKYLLKKQNHIELPTWEWLVVLLISCFTIIELFPACLILKDGPTIFLPIHVLIFLFFNIALVYLLDKLAKWYKVETENIKLHEQMRYNMQNLQNASEAYQAQRRLTHDFDNKILTIAQMLQCERHSEALAYVSTLIECDTRSDAMVSTNHSIVDAVLNQKYRQAQNQDVIMLFIINDLAKFPLTSDELVTVLSNLLDNALDACLFYPKQKKRIIKVKLLLESNFAMISVINTSLPVNICDNDVATSKVNNVEHGYGLKNVKSILYKNDFDLAMHYEDGWFQFTAIKEQS